MMMLLLVTGNIDSELVHVHGWVLLESVTT